MNIRVKLTKSPCDDDDNNTINGRLPGVPGCAVTVFLSASSFRQSFHRRTIKKCPFQLGPLRGGRLSLLFGRSKERPKRK
jgi:hypothetical protein